MSSSGSLNCNAATILWRNLYKNLTKYRPQEWNELVVTVKGNVAHCTCNGEVPKMLCNCRHRVRLTGGDRGQMEYRRIRIKEAN